MGRPRQRRASNDAPKRWRTAPRAALLASALFLLLTLDDRHAGRLSDEAQVAWSAVALAETGSLELAPDARLSTMARAPNGGQVSKYGLGGSLVQLPAALLAPSVERRLGPGASRPLFLVAPFLLVVAAAWIASLLAVALGGSETAAALAVLLVALASPLGSYSSSFLSEPLQAASLAGVLVCALAAARKESGRRALAWAAACGALVGIAVLAKTVLLVAAAPLALPLLATDEARRVRTRVAAAAGGFAAIAGPWAWLEVKRFGSLAGGYTNESFSHPVWDGLLRLLVFPNRGLVFFFPAVVVAVVVLVRLLRTEKGASSTRLAAAGVSLSFLVLLVTSAGWWCWYGNAGWGPRFLVPAVPLLAPFAALDVASWRPRLRVLLVGAGVLLNLPPLFVHPNVMSSFLGWIPAQTISEARARTLPQHLCSRAPDGRTLVAAHHVVPYLPSAAPHVAYPWFARVSFSSPPARAAERLRTPPWLAAAPALVPAPITDPDREMPWVAPRFRWGWGRGFFPDGLDPVAAPVYLDALQNQVRRLLGQGASPELIDLARKRRDLAPGGDSDAHVLEALRLSGRKETALDFVRALTPRARSWPSTAAAIALYLRDLGQLEEARRAMAVAAKGNPTGPYAGLEAVPVADWPADLTTLLAVSPAGRELPPGGPTQ